MKKVIYFSAIVCLFLGCQAQKKLVAVDKETNEVVLKQGQSCEIEFITNASTGFWWQLINDNEVTVVKSVGDRYTSDAPKGMVGASSHRFWKFEAVEKGTQTLHFVYARDRVDQPARTRDVTITVK
ncbi:MAG: protease inhibitor I42 family protein [Bacteroidales bacterium]|jgi:predicted secreted protein|nr:protease inhibitor I42 family protein [Bacteroidales bacterium]MBR4637520.1 protease inhibitor I42 family protein [Bacteroidales bacterium]MBR5921043.1 protease inhibitor I42 family protein [Bacteroidales bacterium]MBR6175671.1 protease inhibitor I42 family protein [Bacteroidales bacterium]MBR6904838.1 protease inhibitor I42 family protein [Bacteroidales bacterium]